MNTTLRKTRCREKKNTMQKYSAKQHLESQRQERKTGTSSTLIDINSVR